MNDANNGAKAKIGVVIVNYRSGAALERCLECLARQEYRDFVTMVVDNDGEACSLNPRFPEVGFVAPGENLGFAAANNLAFRLLGDRVEWFALLNPDAFPVPGWLAALERASREHAVYASFASRCYSGDDYRTLDGVGDEYHVSGFVRRRAHRCADSPRYDSSGEVFSACAAAVFTVKKRGRRPEGSMMIFSAISRMWTLGSACSCSGIGACMFRTPW